MSRKSKRPSPNKPISGALREKIQDKGLTAYAAAKQAGVSVDAVQRFLKEERGLTLGTVDKLANSLDLRLCDDNQFDSAR